VLIVLADQLGVSVGPMYAGAMLPGLMLVGLFCLYVRNSILRPACGFPMSPHPRQRFSSLLAVLIISGVIGVSFWFLQGHAYCGCGIWGGHCRGGLMATGLDRPAFAPCPTGDHCPHPPLA
jgi:TRAP-type C4-dicarboxylate transport system permease large subunit